ncbi:hypothetical protein [Gordonia rhizosphera]|uniref:Uncharacterized protein n=1 Tax=Gordonia rhizosphera NBRC 16068 TaxID=1108045 RepID=K6WKH5_9ACTN|nr:hypothetical protein [Gordonia rhizosphera]GAB92662.1 hypothetical protein GORHZ_186_00320 [Gordonia rhizosphera NBRC 16068]
MSYTALDRGQLAALLPDLMLTGQMIDRAGIPYVLEKFGMDAQTQVAIEEWMGASPNYTRRLREALNVTGDSVEDIFKVLQFDVGAPPQFLDFRYSLTDPYHGEFVNEYCGALIDVEPMGYDLVRSMCHDIQDPTFDATAIATNPKARFRPIHRPPRPEGATGPHCHWKITIEPDREDLPIPDEAIAIARTNAATLPLDPIDLSDEGKGEYTGPLYSDIRFDQWSCSALVRLANEVALEHHLLALSYLYAVRRRTSDDIADELYRKQFTGTAGIASSRIRDCLGLGTGTAGLVQVLTLQPTLNPIEYTGVEVTATGDGDRDAVEIRIPHESPAMADHSWMATVDVDKLGPFTAMGVGLDPHWSAVSGRRDDNGDLVVTIEWSEVPAEECEEVQLTRLSHGTAWVFEDRGIPLPITPVSSTPGASR